MPAFTNSASARPTPDALADCLRTNGQILVIESGLAMRGDLSSLGRALPAVISAGLASGLRALQDIPAYDLDDPWQEHDAAAQPGALRVYEAALKAPSGPMPLAETIPWAAWAALAEGLRPAPGEHWMQLFPCRIGLSAQAVGLIPLAPHSFTAAQVQTMATLVAQWPASLVQSASGAVFLRAEEAFGLAATAPEMIVGQHLAHHPPVGGRSRDWRQLSNEIQMAFHMLADEEDNAGPLAQTPWPWGAGCLPETAVIADRASLRQNTSAPTGQVTLHAPQAIQGLHQWLSQQGSAAALRWWQPNDAGDWVDAWTTVLQTISSLVVNDDPWALIATHGGHARVWVSANRPPPRWHDRLRLSRLRPPSVQALQTDWLALVAQEDAEAYP